MTILKKTNVLVLFIGITIIFQLFLLTSCFNSSKEIKLIKGIYFGQSKDDISLKYGRKKSKLKYITDELYQPFINEKKYLMFLTFTEEKLSGVLIKSHDFMLDEEKDWAKLVKFVSKKYGKISGEDYPSTDLLLKAYYRSQETMYVTHKWELEDRTIKLGVAIRDEKWAGGQTKTPVFYIEMDYFGEL